MQVDARVMPRVRQPRIRKAPRDLTFADRRPFCICHFTSIYLQSSPQDCRAKTSLSKVTIVSPPVMDPKKAEVAPRLCGHRPIIQNYFALLWYLYLAGSTRGSNTGHIT
jgi:hypothetical protein